MKKTLIYLCFAVVLMATMLNCSSKFAGRKLGTGSLPPRIGTPPPR